MIFCGLSKKADENYAVIKTADVRVLKMEPGAIYKWFDSDEYLTFSINKPKKKSIKRVLLDGKLTEVTEIILGNEDGLQLIWQLIVPELDKNVVIKLSLYNGSNRSLRLSKLILADTKGMNINCTGDAHEWLLSGLCYNSRIGFLSEVLPSVNEVGRGLVCLILIN